MSHLFVGVLVFVGAPLMVMLPNLPLYSSSLTPRAALLGHFTVSPHKESHPADRASCAGTEAHFILLRHGRAMRGDEAQELWGAVRDSGVRRLGGREVCDFLHVLGACRTAGGDGFGGRFGAEYGRSWPESGG